MSTPQRDKCSCGNFKDQNWHLACPHCWALVPRHLQARVYLLYKSGPGTEAHLTAVREAYEHIRSRRAAMETEAADFSERFHKDHKSH